MLPVGQGGEDRDAERGVAGNAICTFFFPEFFLWAASPCVCAVVGVDGFCHATVLNEWPVVVLLVGRNIVLGSRSWRSVHHFWFLPLQFVFLVMGKTQVNPQPCYPTPGPTPSCFAAEQISALVPHVKSPDFGTAFVWVLSGKELRELRSRRTPVKLQCYRHQADDPDRKRCVVWFPSVACDGGGGGGGGGGGKGFRGRGRVG